MSTLTITRRLNNANNRLHDEFKSLYQKSDFEHIIFELCEAGNKSNRDSILAELFDMFKLFGIKFEEGKDNKYYVELVEKTKFLSFSEIEDKIIYSLYSEYQEYPNPEEYMLRIVDRLSNDSEWKEESLRLRILKQFIKYGNFLKDAGYGGRGAIEKQIKIARLKKKFKDIDENELKTRLKTAKKPTVEEVLVELDEEVFNLLTDATKEQRRHDGTYGLIKLADDLALGKFRTGGNTKRSLYLFAMVYNMTYCPIETESDEEIKMRYYKSDVEKNLFRDYYCNNLIRFITQSYKGRKCEYDMNPTGQGINYKNYAEMVYIYYISTNYEPAEKIKLATEMINRLEAHGAKKTNAAFEKDNATLYFRNLFTEEILEKNETEFEEFICDNYDLGNINEKKENTILVSSEQKTAYKNYEKIIRKLNVELDKAGTSMENCNYGLWFTDVAAFRKNNYTDICDRINKQLDEKKKKIDKTRFSEFVELLEAVNDYLGYTVKEASSSDKNENQEWSDVSKAKTKALYITDAKSITRTSMIVAYYYYYNILHENTESKIKKSFEEVFNDFQKGVNVYLENSYYQPLDGRSIFDIMVVFSAYAYLNL